MPTLKLLYEREYPITDKIKIMIPSVGEVSDNEDEYYGLVRSLTAMPIDMMVELDDAGIDFTAINDYELFCILFSGIQRHDAHLIFGDLDLTKFQPALNEETGVFTFVDAENDIVIDRTVQQNIAMILRKIHHLKKDTRTPGNKEARDYMIKRARKKAQRHRNAKEASQIESLIIAMVNTEQFKYDYESVRGLSIYQFNESVHQIIHKVDYDNRMFGVYSGTVSAKDLSQDELNWLTHK